METKASETTETTENREETGDRPLMDANSAAIKKLIQRAKDRGYITYEELNQILPPDQMSGRITTPFQRALTTTVNDIEHIVANSYTGFGIIKIFFQPNVDIRTANAQVTAISQTLLRQMPPGATPPLILNYSASTVPILQVALSGDGLTEQNLADIGINQLRDIPLDLYPEFVKELEEASGLDLGYSKAATLQVALDRDDEESLRHHQDYHERLGLPMEWLSGAEARREEPALSPRVCAGLRVVTACENKSQAGAKAPQRSRARQAPAGDGRPL